MKRRLQEPIPSRGAPLAPGVFSRRCRPQTVQDAPGRPSTRRSVPALGGRPSTRRACQHGPRASTRRACQHGPRRVAVAGTAGRPRNARGVFISILAPARDSTYRDVSRVPKRRAPCRNGPAAPLKAAAGGARDATRPDRAVARGVRRARRNPTTLHTTHTDEHVCCVCACVCALGL